MSDNLDLSTTEYQGFLDYINEHGLVCLKGK